MEIRIKKTGLQTINGDPGASDVTNAYRVIDNGKEFVIMCRSHSHGGSIGIAGKEGVLYTDRENNTVRRQVLAVGRGCGIGVENDELVEGLSPWAIRGVILADRNKETGELTIRTRKKKGVDDHPAVLLDGQITDLHRYL